MYQCRSVAASVLCILMIVGCTPEKGSSAKLSPASGTVTVDGKPSPRIVVRFIPKSGTPGNGAFGQTDGRGKYTLMQTSGEEGILPGEYDVTFSQFAMPDGTAVRLDIQPESVGAVQALPEHYTDASTSEIEASVTGGSNSFDFALESE